MVCLHPDSAAEALIERMFQFFQDWNDVQEKQQANITSQAFVTDELVCWTIARKTIHFIHASLGEFTRLSSAFINLWKQTIDIVNKGLIHQ